MRTRRTGRTPQGKLEEKLAEAVRNSLNLPELEVGIRQIRSRRSWAVLLQKNGARSEWIELDAGAVAIIRKIGLLPAIHLGTFRLAYDALRQATERISHRGTETQRR